jgi:hypothetical protein
MRGRNTEELVTYEAVLCSLFSMMLFYIALAWKNSCVPPKYGNYFPLPPGK